MEISVILSAIVFFVIGYTIAFFIAKSKQSRLEERNENLSRSSEQNELKLQEETARANHAEKELTKLQAEYAHLEERLSEQKEQLTELQEQFRTEFKNLANEILEEKSKKFTEQNKEKLDQLLKPLGEKLEAFKKKVEETHKDEVEARGSLKQELKHLMELNQKMSEDANNLTKALKGDNKAVGDWGEIILERILERSGLTKGREYETQKGFTKEDGMGHNKPDVVVYLPDDKYMIIDSKVSLKAYEKYSSTEDEDDQRRYLKEHVNSIRNHVKGLSEKKYQQIHGEKSPNFVLLFIPIEPAFASALQNDSNIYYEAFDKNIVIVSPSTLLATLATIDSVWKQEYQNKNAMEIAKRGGALYDKFVLFAESMESVGTRIRQTQESYDEAMGRLSTGAGSLVRQAEMIRKLGANTTKQLPDYIIGQDEDQLED